MAEKTLVEIMLDMFDGKTSVAETAARMHEAFYGRPCSAEEAKEAMGMTMTDNERKLAFLLATSPHLAAVHGRTYEEAASDLSANGVLVREKGEWKYYRKQGIAVCTSCSFERKVDDNFGRAVACPNCGEGMKNRPCIKCANYERCKKRSFGNAEWFIKKRLTQNIIYGKECWRMPPVDMRKGENG